MNTENLVSILVLSYNNLQYFKECIDSILNQKYPYIEIILSDDCSSEFNADEIIDYIEKNKKDNIVNYVVNRNEDNLGIVKNFNNAIKLSSGNYLVHIACDDTFYDDEVISSIVEFYKNNSSYIIAVGYLAYFDEKLELFNGYTPIEANIPFIHGEAIDCYKKLCSLGSFFPSPGLSYKRELIDKYGLYDEEYVIVDDYSRFLYLTRSGCRIGFIGKYLIKYRAAGITSSIQRSPKVKELLEKDFELIKRKEILPYAGYYKANFNVKHPSKVLVGITSYFIQKTIVNGDGVLTIGENSTFGYDVSPHFDGFHILLQARYEYSCIEIGNNNKFSNDITMIAVKKISIGNDCLIGDRVNIVDCDFHEINPDTRINSYGLVDPVVIGNNVWIGSGVTILKGVKIGDNCVIGANSVVTRDIEKNSIACGNPARVTGDVFQRKYY